MCHMSFLREVKSWLGLNPDSSTPAHQINKKNPLFVYIKIPGDFGPLDRGELFEDPIQKALDLRRLGTLTGGGSQLSAPDENGKRSIEFCGIDVDLYDAANGLALLRNELVRL